MNTTSKPTARDALRSAFRLAINKSKTRSEARRLDKLRSRYFAGKLTPTDAMLAWLDLTLDVKPPKTVTNERGVTRVVA